MPKPNPGNCDDDCEFAVISHPMAQHPGPGIIKHVHDDRVVCTKKEANEFTLEPMVQQERLVGHNVRQKYVRTDDKDALGRSVFKPIP